LNPVTNFSSTVLQSSDLNVWFPELGVKCEFTESGGRLTFPDVHNQNRELSTINQSMLRPSWRVANFDNLPSAWAEAYQTVHKFEVKFDKVCEIILSFYDDIADFEKDEETALSYIYMGFPKVTDVQGNVTTATIERYVLLK
jgi:hypothetical protein